MNKSGDYSLAIIDDAWSAVHRATLLFIVQGTQVLLIRKKRGLGAGKINGPGGKQDPGESALDCAVREIKEELGIVALNPVNHGRLRFQFLDDYSIDVQVFLAQQYQGEPCETAEAIPLWFEIDKIPYAEMWADDRIWLPRVLAGESVNGRFIFDGDSLGEHDVEFAAGPRQE